MKPNIEKSTPKDDELTLDISMLTPEMYRLEKQQKQEELIRRANEQKFVESQEIIQEEKYDITEDSNDILSLVNFLMQQYNVKPLSEIEGTQIIDLVKDLSQIDFKQWLATGKLPGSTVKNLVRLGKIGSIVQNTVIPRIKDAYDKYKVNKDKGDYNSI